MDIRMHIGLPKTGSTAIQRNLQRRRDRLLADQSVLFPVSLGNPSVNLAVAFQAVGKLDDQRMQRSIRTADDIRNYTERLARLFSQEVGRKRPGTVLISSEHLASRLTSEEEIRALKDFLAQHTEDIGVYLYLRRQDELALSYYSTAVKNGETSVFRFPEGENVPPDFYFDRLLNIWSRVFGRESIHVRIYERDCLVAGDIVADFYDFVNLPFSGGEGGDRENPSISRELLEFLRRFNSHVPKFIDSNSNVLRGDIASVIDELGVSGTQLIADEAAMERFQGRFTTGNRNVAQQFFNRAELFPERPARACSKNSSAGLDGDWLIELTARIWMEKQRRYVEMRNLLRREVFVEKVARAELALERGNTARAQSILGNILNNYEDVDQAYYFLATISVREGNHDVARTHIERALALAPENEMYMRLRDEIYSN